MINNINISELKSLNNGYFLYNKEYYLKGIGQNYKKVRFNKSIKRNFCLFLIDLNLKYNNKVLNLYDLLNKDIIELINIKENIIKKGFKK